MGERALAWYELYYDLRSKIKSGELRAEAEINKSMVATSAADIDFTRAVNRLVDEGLIRHGRSDRLYVARTRARSRRSASFQEDYASQGRSPTMKTISFDMVPLEEALQFVQDALKNSDCTTLARHFHVQSVDGVPIIDGLCQYS